MKIERCRVTNSEGESTSRLMIVINERKVLSDEEYKTKVYNEIFDYLCTIWDELVDEMTNTKSP